MQRKDLLNVVTIGTDKLCTFMKQHILYSEPKTKRKRPKNRTSHGPQKHQLKPRRN